MAKLKRVLGLFETTMYGVGIILGAGIYVLIGQAAGIAGNAMWISFLAAAVVSVFTGLSFAELSTMFPKESAGYLYTKMAFKSSALSFLVGWLILFVLVVAAAAVALGFGGYLSAMFGVPIIPSALVLIALLTFLNHLGIKDAAWANIMMTVIELFGVLLIIALGFGHFGSVDYFEMPAGMGGVMSAAILVFFAYLGFENLVNISEEVKNPRKTMPKAIVYSIAITTIIYILVALSSVSIIPWQQLGLSKAPLADVANAAWPGSAALLSGIALFSTTNTVLFLLIACSRMMYGMAREGALHKMFAAVHEARQTPTFSIIVTMLLSMAFVMIGNIKTVAELTNWGTFMIFISVNASLIALRKTEPKAKRPFRVPFRIGWFPVLPFLGILTCLVMLASFTPEMTLYGIGIMAAGLIVYGSISAYRKH